MRIARLYSLVAVACLSFLTACASVNGTSSGTSPQAWGQIAAGVGQVIGKTKADEAVARAGVELAKYCGWLRAGASAVTIFAPEKQQLAALQASAAINTVCDHPPIDVRAALITAAEAYAAVVAAGTK